MISGQRLVLKNRTTDDLRGQTANFKNVVEGQTSPNTCS